MQVKTTREFFDKQEQVVRKVGDVFDVSQKRYQELLKSPFAPLVSPFKTKKDKD